MSGRDDAFLPGDLSLKLARLDGHVRGLALLRGTGLLVVVVIIGIAVGLLVDLQWELSVGVRIGILAAVGLAGVVTGWRLLRPCLRLPSAAELAAIVERTHPELNERLSSTVELHDSSIPDAHKGSRYMRGRLAEETIDSVAGLNFSDSLSRTRSVRSAVLGAGALLMLLAPLLFSPSGYGLLLARFFQPWKNFDSAGNLFFEVENGDRVVARGTDVLINAKPRFRDDSKELPDTVWLNWTDAAGQTDSRRMQLDRQTDTFVTNIPHVFHGFDYHVSAGRPRSRDYHIDVVEPPAIAGLTLEVEPPAYTGLPAETHDGVVGRIEVFERSRLTFRMRFNKPITDAALGWLQPDSLRADPQETNERDDREPISEQPQTDQVESPGRFTLARDGRAGTLELAAIRSGPFGMTLTDEFGLHNFAEPSRILVVTPDEAPQLTLADSNGPQGVRPSDVVPVRVTATDDVGVGELELHYEISQAEQKNGKLTVERATLGSRSVSHVFQLDLAALDFSEGTVVTYRVRAADERPVPGPNEVWSEPRVLVVKRDAKPLGSDDVARRQQDLKRMLARIQDDVKKNRNQVAGLHNEARSNLRKRAEFARNEEIPPLSREQRDIAGRVEQLADRFAEHPLFTNLTEQTQQIAREELAQSSDHLRQAADAQLREKTKHLWRSDESLARAEEGLREIEKRFDELAEIERDLLELNRLARQAEQLAEQAAALDHQRQNHPDGLSPEQQQARERQLAQQQQQLEEQRQDLARQLNDLLQRRPELVDAARRDQLDRLAKLSKRALEIAEPEDLLADALRKEADESANKFAPLAEKQTERLARELDKNKQLPADPQQAEQALRDLGKRAEVMAKAESSVDQSETAETPSRAQQAQSRQQELARAAAELALETARQTGADSPPAKQLAETTREAVQAAREALGGQLGQAGRTARRAAESAQQAADQLQDAGQPAGANQQLERKARELAQQQAQAADELSRLADSPAERRSAQRAGQEQLAGAARALSNELGDAAQKLATDPLNLPLSGRRAQKAQQETDQGRQAMQQAARQLGQYNSSNAARQAQQAADALRRAAGQAAQAASADDRPQSPIPPEVGSQVTEAARRLREAQQQLAEASQQSGQQSSKHGQQPGQSQQPGQQQANQGQIGTQGQGATQPQTSPGRSAQSLRRAAQALAQAARQMQPGQSNSAAQRSQGSRPAGSQLAADPQDSDGNSGGGAQVAVDLERLELELKQLAGRQWGQLPGKLRTEILQAARRKPNSDYAKLIKLYFQEIAGQGKRKKEKG